MAAICVRLFNRFCWPPDPATVGWDKHTGLLPIRMRLLQRCELTRRQRKACDTKPQKEFGVSGSVDGQYCLIAAQQHQWERFLRAKRRLLQYNRPFCCWFHTNTWGWVVWLQRTNRLVCYLLQLYYAFFCERVVKLHAYVRRSKTNYNRSRFLAFPQKLRRHRPSMLYRAPKVNIYLDWDWLRTQESYQAAMKD